MKIIDRYLLQGHLAPFLLALGILTFVLLMDRLFELIDLLIGKSVALGTVAWLFFLGLPNIIALTVPMAVLIACLMTFGRLTQDNELTAFRSSGLPLARLMAWPLAVSAALVVALFLFSDRVLPDANHDFKNLLMDISQTRPSLKLRENTFISDFPGYSIIIRKVNARNSELQGVTIYEQGDASIPRTIIAERGQLTMLPHQQVLRLELRKGEIHEVDRADPSRYHRMSFKTHTINLPMSQEMEHQVRESRSDREMSSAMMRRAIAGVDSQLAPLRARMATESQLQSWQREQLHQEVFSRTAEVRRYQVEIQKKMAIPVACLVFVLLGAPLGTITKRGGMGVSFGLSLLFFTLYYIALIGGEELADRQLLSPVLAMWAANIVLGACGLALSVVTTLELRLWPRRA